jgi:hypothetical protein
MAQQPATPSVLADQATDGGIAAYVYRQPQVVRFQPAVQF